MMVSPEKFVQRCDITTGVGERAVLTFELMQQECLQSAYKGVQVVKRWVLHSITGESAVGAPQQPDSSLSPDAVALAQLNLLRYSSNFPLTNRTVFSACMFAMLDRFSAWRNTGFSMTIVYPGVRMFSANTVDIPRVQKVLISSACSRTGVADK